MLATNNVNESMFYYYNITNYTTAINREPAVSYDTTGCVPRYVFTPNKRLMSYSFLNFTLSYQRNDVIIIYLRAYIDNYNVSNP